MGDGFGKKYALLIGSSYHDLKGTKNDVEHMESVLAGYHGFSVTKCYGKDATRNGILEAWERLIERVQSEHDVALIFYSGHGGILESNIEPQGGPYVNNATSTKVSRRYQYILPIDFDESFTMGFRGILDAEISDLLQRTTDKTQNVVTIFDCCYAGRMARDPVHGDQARAKQWNPDSKYFERYLKFLRDFNFLQKHRHSQGNPFAVRLSAAAPTETAWEYAFERGKSMGAFTKALVEVMRETASQEVSWRTTMIRVREMVNLRWPYQHPQADGPQDRLQFLLQEKNSGALPFQVRGSTGWIKGGRIAGVKKRNRYSIMPPHSERAGDTKLTEVEVKTVRGFDCDTDFDGSVQIPIGALAFPLLEVPHRFPVALHEVKSSLVLGELRLQLEKSRFLEVQENESQACLVSFREETSSNGRGRRLCMYGTQSTLLADEHMSSFDLSYVDQIVHKAERVAQAQNFLRIQPGQGIESLRHWLEVGFFHILPGRLKLLAQNGAAELHEGQRFSVQLRNRGTQKLFVFAFSIDVAGKIVSMVPDHAATGVELLSRHEYTIGKSQFDDEEEVQGLEMEWPDGIPRKHSVVEHVMVIVTDTAVDLSGFSMPDLESSNRHEVDSTLQELMQYLIFAERRGAKVPYSPKVIRYDALGFSFLHRPRTSSHR